MNLLTNKYVLYFIAFLSIVNILSYFFEGQFGAIGFFTLVAFLMFYFTSNLIIVLGISLFATNLLTSIKKKKTLKIHHIILLMKLTRNTTK